MEKKDFYEELIMYTVDSCKMFLLNVSFATGPSYSPDEKNFLIMNCLVNLCGNLITELSNPDSKTAASDNINSFITRLGKWKENVKMAEKIRREAH